MDLSSRACLNCYTINANFICQFLDGVRLVLTPVKCLLIFFSLHEPHYKRGIHDDINEAIMIRCSALMLIS